MSLIQHIPLTPLRSWSISKCSCGSTEAVITDVEVKGVKVSHFIICFEISFIQKCCKCDQHSLYPIGTYRHTHNHIEFCEEWEHLRDNVKKLKELSITDKILEKMKEIEVESK